MKTPGILLIAIAFILSFAPSGHAILTEWRTQVQVSLRPGNNTQFAFDGGLNAPSASQILSSSGEIAEASSELNAGGFIPTLRARATSDSTHAQAVAWGVQGYTNTAATALDTSLMLDLSATITGSNDLQARVLLFQDENFEYFGDPGTILFESSSQLWPGFEPFANNLGPAGFGISINGQAGPVDEHRSFDFTVQPGDSFYVWARLVATADVPGVVDAYSTLTASLSDTTGLAPASVPEPGSAVLLALGAGAFAFRRPARD